MPDADAAQRIASFRRKFARRRRVETAVARAAGVLCTPPKTPAVPETAPDRILVIQRVLRIGDTLVARPALAALRRRYPGARIAVVCSAVGAPVCKADTLVDDVIVTAGGWLGWTRALNRARAYRGDIAFVFVMDRFSPWFARAAGCRRTVGYDYAGRGAPLTERITPPARANVPAFLYEDAPPVRAADIWNQLVGGPPTISYPPFDPGDAARREVAYLDGLTGSAAVEPFIILHPGAANRSYQWEIRNWVNVGRALSADGARVVVTGSSGEAELAAAVATQIPAALSVAGKLSLLGMFALVEAARLAVSVDTSSVHIAATVGTPVVALYGPGDPEMWAPLGVPNRVLAAADTPCSGCKSARCFQVEHYCMGYLAAADVITAARSLLP